jgi:alpha-D-ribose 1-methylphosphonate 5-triphosphate synthase subunit PhnG
VTPEQRYATLAAAQREDLLALADEILAAEPVTVSVLEAPTVGIGALRLPAPADGSFVVGHVVLTTGAVVLDGQRGDGIRPGRDPEGALAAALCDAEAERGGARAGAVDALVARAEATQHAERAATARLVDATRLGAPA